MNNGFSLLEVIIALTISLSVLSVVITSVSDSAKNTKNIHENQEVLESIFHTVDSLKADLTKCGMRLQEAGKLFKLPIFKNSEIGFETLMGIATLYLQSEVDADSTYIQLPKDDYLKKKRAILIYDTESNCFEFNEIEDIEKGVDCDTVSLIKNTKNRYEKNAVIIILKTVAFKYYIKEQVLKRKTDHGYFQPMIDNVTDFYLKYFPESKSLLYRIEVGHKEQIRGYIFLVNMVQK